MRNLARAVLISFLLLSAGSTMGFAMKPEPEYVDPVENEKYRVSVVNKTAECFGFYPEGGVIRVSDADDGSFLFWMSVYRVNGRYSLENLYITDIGFDEKNLWVKTDEGIEFMVNLDTKSVTLGKAAGNALNRISLKRNWGKERCPAENW